MSRVRGVFPLFLATGLGIVNGIWVFGPVLKERQLEKNEQARRGLEIAHQSDDENVTILRNAEAAANRYSTTASTLKAEGSPDSWWPTWSFWSKKIAEKTSNGAPRDVAPEQSNIENRGSK